MHLADEWVHWFLDGNVSQAMPLEVSAHLATCNACKERISKQVPQAIEDSPREPAAVDERRCERRLAVDEPASIKMLSPFEPEPVTIRVLDVSRHGVTIWSPVAFERGVILQLRMREMLIMGEVRYCTKSKDGFQAGLYIEDCVERRESPRTDAKIPATIFNVPNAAKPQQEYPARILNQSNRGMLVTLPERMPPGAAVRLLAQGKLYVGEVIYCLPEEDGFKVGLVVDQALTL